MFIDPETGSTVTLERVTVTGNALGGIFIRDFGSGIGSSVTIFDSTIAGNTGSGINIPIGTDLAIHVRGTTISGNTPLAGATVFRPNWTLSARSRSPPPLSRVTPPK